MIDYYDLQNSMTPDQVAEEVLKIYRETKGDEDKCLDFLSELASYVYSCPDASDNWAVAELSDILDNGPSDL